MSDKHEIQILAKKITHQYGRHWNGYLSPTEILFIAKNGAVFRKGDLAAAKIRKSTGNSGGYHMAFDVSENSILFETLKNT